MPVRRGLHLARHGLLRGTAVLLILAASLVGILRLALPWLADQPALLAQVLGEAFQTRASVQSASSQWGGSGPILTLHQLELGEPDSPERIQIAQSDVRIDLFGFLPGRRWVREISIASLSLTVERQNGRWGISGLPTPTASRDEGALLRWLDRLGAVRLHDVSLEVIDHDEGWRLRPPAGDVLLARSDGRLRVGMRLGDTDHGMLQLVLHPGPDHRSGQLWLGVDALDLAHWRERLIGAVPSPRHGLLNGGIWIDWAAGQVRTGQLDLQLEGVGLVADSVFDLPGAGPVEAQAGLADGRVLAHWWSEQALQRLSVDWEDASGRAEVIDAQWHSPSGAAQVLVRQLELHRVGALLPLLDLPERARATLYQLYPRGRIERLHWQRPAEGDWWLEADLVDLAATADMRRWPGVEGLNLRLMADARGGLAEIVGPPPRVQWDGAWPETIALEELTATVALVRDEDQPWQLLADGIQLSYRGATAQARARITLAPGEPPYVQLEARANGPLEPSREFWVRSKMSPKAVAWLEQALDNGQLDEARFYYRGAPRDWPFDQAQGRLELDARGSGLSLDYHPDWPTADIHSARARIVNRSIFIDRVEGVVSGVPAQASGRIANYREPILDLAISGAGEAADLLRLLRHSPLEHRHGSLLLGMEVSGQVATNLELRVPLKRELGAPELDGLARIDGLDFRDAKWNTHVSDVHGEARYSLAGFEAQDLQVRFGASEPVALELALGERYSGDADLKFKASMDGRIAAGDLFADHAETLAPILREVAGESRWQGSLEVREAQPTRLNLRSDLIGTRITLPAPLSKSASLAAPLTLKLETAVDLPALVQLQLGQALPLTMQAQLALRELPFRAELRLGKGQAALPATAGLTISGSADTVDLGAWATWLAMQTVGGGLGLSLNSIDLKPANIILLGASERAESLQFRSDTIGGWLAELRSEAISGSVRLDQRGGAPALSAEFDRLHLPDAADAGTQGASLDPRTLPALHFSAADLRVGKALLGQTRIEAYPTAEGLRFEQLEARSDGLTLAGSGRWGVDSEGVIGSSFQLRFSAEDLGLMLAGLGFAAPVEGGQTLASIDARWAGPPTAFGLERLQGTMEVSVGTGRLLDLSPGAGRVFGLLSLRALPRRLALDFRDVFETGLAFDSIKGSFDFQEGNAWTTNLNVRGPAADISIIGRTGLALRDYDQEVQVQPRVGSAFPVVGAIAGGPAGAAAGLIMQGMLGRGLDDANSYLYNVTGTWEDPAVERVDRPPASRRPAEG
jgi:uncharacterized protein (TIGR02099 family)